MVEDKNVHLTENVAKVQLSRNLGTLVPSSSRA